MNVVGIFVGGAARRFGGRHKGLLTAPGSSVALIDRTASIAASTLRSDVILVGDATGYADRALSSLDDAPPGIGPLGGLSALLAAAAERGGAAFAIACDMPRVDATLLSRLATHAPAAAAVAPRLDGRWQPLFARYDPGQCRAVVDHLIAERRHSMQGIFDALAEAAVPLPVATDEEILLEDWDRPEDVSP